MQYRQKRILHFSKQNSTEKTGNITNDAVKRCGSAPAKAYITFKIWQKRISNNASNDAVRSGQTMRFSLLSNRVSYILCPRVMIQCVVGPNQDVYGIPGAGLDRPRVSVQNRSHGRTMAQKKLTMPLLMQHHSGLRKALSLARGRVHHG